MKNKKILFSIIVCTYNREKHIKRCLESLMNLNYPKSNYEIIVVDDGSTDSTIKIVNQFPVRLVKHKKNKGIAAARNTGLKAAKGRIYICFDDDCFAHKNWLKKLDKAYKNADIKNVLGIAGFIQLINNGGIIDRYMDEIGYANPSPIIYGMSKNPIIRFYAYLKNMFFPISQQKKKLLEVNEIWGANCSFPVEILKGVKGWNTKLSGVEDTDLCNRINNKYKNKKFICTKDAIIYHDHQLSLQGFINKPYSRGSVTLKFYQKNNKFPPIYPFPIAILIISLSLMIINPIYGIISILLTPHLFYSWWLLKAVQKMKLYYMTFPYLQGGYELATVLGIFKGYI